MTELRLILTLDYFIWYVVVLQLSILIGSYELIPVLNWMTLVVFIVKTVRLRKGKTIATRKHASSVLLIGLWIPKRRVACGMKLNVCSASTLHYNN